MEPNPPADVNLPPLSPRAETPESFTMPGMPPADTSAFGGIFRDLPTPHGMRANAQPVTFAPGELLTVEPKSFLASRTLWAALVGLFLVPLLARIGIAFDDAQTQELVDALVKLAGLAGVIYGRAKARRPITLGTGSSATLLAAVLLTVLLGGCRADQKDIGVGFALFAIVAGILMLLGGRFLK